jgi:LDH2 family malate/lactate/ureidoglycolate dehydrogenase
VSIPGIYEADIVEERRTNGIPLHPQVVTDLKLLADELGMEYNL